MKRFFKIFLAHLAAVCAIFLLVLWVLDYYNPLLKLLHRKITTLVVIVGFISILLVCLINEVDFYRQLKAEHIQDKH